MTMFLIQFEGILKEVAQSEIADIFEVHYQMIVEKIEKSMDEVRDILDGTRKREVTNWWLTYIEEKADEVMGGLFVCHLLFLKLSILFHFSTLFLLIFLFCRLAAVSCVSGVLIRSTPSQLFGQTTK